MITAYNLTNIWVVHTPMRLGLPAVTPQGQSKPAEMRFRWVFAVTTALLALVFDSAGEVVTCSGGRWHLHCSANARCEAAGLWAPRYRCLCKDGYRGNGLVCTDIDECSEGSSLCSDESTCINLPGTYRCQCPLSLLQLKSCEETSQLCPFESRVCSKNAECLFGLDTQDFYCQCMRGYTGDGVVCSDIDECITGEHNCHHNAVCKNKSPSFQCSCLPGFEGDGVRCNDVDECQGDKNLCHKEAECINTSPDHRCVCQPGFTGDGLMCQDVDECRLGSHNCSKNATCINASTGCECVCNEGFTGDGLSCTELLTTTPGYQSTTRLPEQTTSELTNTEVQTTSRYYQNEETTPSHKPSTALYPEKTTQLEATIKQMTTTAYPQDPVEDGNTMMMTPGQTDSAASPAMSSTETMISSTSSKIGLYGSTTIVEVIETEVTATGSQSNDLTTGAAMPTEDPSDTMMASAMTPSRVAESMTRKEDKGHSTRASEKSGAGVTDCPEGNDTLTRVATTDIYGTASITTPAGTASTPIGASTGNPLSSTEDALSSVVYTMTSTEDTNNAAPVALTEATNDVTAQNTIVSTTNQQTTTIEATQSPVEAFFSSSDVERVKGREMATSVDTTKTAACEDDCSTPTAPTVKPTTSGGISTSGADLRPSTETFLLSSAADMAITSVGKMSSKLRSDEQNTDTFPNPHTTGLGDRITSTESITWLAMGSKKHQ